MRAAGVVFVISIALLACAGPTTDLASDEPLDRRILVVSHGLHSGVVVAREDLAPGVLPEASAFPAARYFELGWGDHIYYPMPHPPLHQALRAALLPSAAVIHLVAHATRPASAPGVEVLEIAISSAGLAAMIARIDAAFAREGAARAPMVAPGPTLQSSFHPAIGTFHLFNNCNTWVARKLTAAGVPIGGAWTVSAGDLTRRLRELPSVEPVHAD